MTSLLVVNLIMAATVLLASCGVAFSSVLHLHPSTFITIVNAAVATGAAFVGCLARRACSPCIVISSLALVILPFSCTASVNGWRHVNDGVGLQWVFLVGGLCLVAVVVGTFTGIASLYRSLRQRRINRDGP